MKTLRTPQRIPEIYFTRPPGQRDSIEFRRHYRFDLAERILPVSFFMATETTPEQTTRTRQTGELPWSVVVLNDPVNLMSYVVMVFKRVFGYSQERATRHMLEVHEQGRSIVWTGGREEAETYVHLLQGWQLQARLEPGAEA